MNVFDPNDQAWLAAVRESQTPESVEIESKLRAWLADGTLPKLKLWHGRAHERTQLPSGRIGGGDCEVTACALYRDLCRAKLDAGWTLVSGDLAAIGRHYWNVWRGPEGAAQAVNVNMGRVMVIPLALYLKANGGSEDELYEAAPRSIGKLYAGSTRINGGHGTIADAAAFDVLTSEAFGMPLRFPPEFHAAAEAE